MNTLGVAIDRLGAVTKTNVSSNVIDYTLYGKALDGLSARQIALALSTKNLSNAELEEIIRVNHLIEKYGAEELIKVGLLSANSALLVSEKTISVEKAKELLLTANVNEELREMLISKHLSTVADGEEATAKQVLIKELLDETVAKKLITAENAKEILSSEGVILNDVKEIASKEALIEALKRERMARLSLVNVLSLGAIAFGVASIAIAKKTEESIEEVRNRAKELNDTFNDGKSSIDNYKSQIDDLYSTIKDSSSSVEEVTTARRTLMSVQDELIAKFGDEKETIDLITQAINGQSTALDELTQKQWQATKNDFNKSNWLNDFGNWQEGYSDNIDRMVHEMENAWGSITMSTSDYFGGEYDDIIKRLEEAGWEYSSAYENFIKGGSVEDLYEEILDIQTLVGDDMPDNFLNSLTNNANGLKETLDNYEGMWDNYILNDKIFADDNLADSWKEVNDAYTKYQNAVASGDKTAIEEATSGFATSINEVLNDENVSDSVKDYFRDMYPALYREVEKWEFKTNIITEFDTSGLQGKTQTDVLKMLQTNGTQEGENVFNSILESADKYGLVIGEDSEKIKQLLDLLVQWGILQGEISNVTDDFLDEPIELWDFSEMMSQLDSAKDKLSTLDEAFSKLFDDADANTNIGFEDFSAIHEAFSDVSNIEDYITRLQDAGQNTEQVRLVMEDLIGAYLEQSQILNNVTEDNKDLIITMLEEMGVANAEEIVLSQLNAETERLSIEKQFLSECTADLANVTIAEINEFAKEFKNAQEVRYELARLALEKQTVNGTVLDFSGDISNLISFVETLNGATYALNTLNYVKEQGAYLPTDALEGLKKQAEQDVQDTLKNAKSYTPKINDVKIKPDYKGGTNTNKAVKDASSSSKEFKKTFDWIETALSRVQRTITNLGKTVSATYKKWSTRNNALAQEMSAISEEISLQESAYNAYMSKAESVGLSDHYKKLVQSGSLSIEDIADEALAEQIELYKEYHDKALDCADAIEDLRASLAELAMTKFNHIASEFENKMSLIEHKISMIDGYISQSEASGQWTSGVYYKALVKQEEKNVKQLQAEYDALIEQFNENVNNGHIEKYSQDWYEMYENINKVEEELQKANTALLEYKQTLQQIDWDIFDRSMDYKGNLTDESDFMIDLLDNEKLYEDNGSLTDEGLSVQGLHAMNYNVYMEKASAYAKEIQKLNKQIAKDPHDLELIDRRNELIGLQQESIQNAMSEKDAIHDLIADGYDKMLASLQELINKRKEALQAEKDLYDYKAKIEEKTNEIASYRKQLEAYEGDNSEEAKATIQKLKVGLEKSEKDLEKTEYEKYIEDQEALLDDLYSQTEEWINSRLDNLDTLVAEAVNATNNNAGVISDTLHETSDSVNYTLSNQMSSIWADEKNDLGDFKNVVKTYGDILDNGQNTLNTTIENGNTSVQNSLSTIDTDLQEMKKAMDEQAKNQLATIAALQEQASKSQSSSSSSSSSSSTSTGSGSGSSTGSNGTGGNGGSGGSGGGSSSKTYAYTVSASGQPDQSFTVTASSETEADAKVKAYVDELNEEDEDAGYSWKRAYASGTTNALRGLNLISEKGDEVVLDNDGNVILAKGMQLYPFKGGETVLNAKDTSKFLQGNLVPLNAEQLWSNIVKTPSLPDVKSNVGGNVTNYNQFSFDLPNVVDANSLITELQHNKRFEKIIDSMTADKMIGKNSLGKLRF